MSTEKNMKKQIVAAVLGVAVVCGVGVGIAANALTTDPPQKSRTSAGSTLTPVSKLVVKPGAVGPIAIGTSRRAALASGYFVRGVSPVEGCPAPPLAWRQAYADALDVYTLGNGEISSIGIRGTGPRTQQGLGVGSTWGEVKKHTEAAQEAGYNQSGAFVYDRQNGGYVGFLFNEGLARLTDASKVTFVEVTKGNEPSLMRDGC